MLQEIKRIPLEGLHNTRDLGGLLTEDGKSIKHHRLIRSGNLHIMTKEDKKILVNEYELTTVIDFRTEAEQIENPDQVMEGVLYISNPILEEETLGITRESKTDKDLISMVLNRLENTENGEISYMENMYRNLITNDFCIKQYRKFFEFLINQEKGAILWHCTAGKDRVGIGTALLLSILGVKREQIIADYLMTNEFSAEHVEKVVQGIYAKTQNAQLAEKIRVMFGVQENYIQMVFETIENKYGTWNSFLEKEMKLGKEEVQLLRNKYLQ